MVAWHFLVRKGAGNTWIRLSEWKFKHYKTAVCFSHHDTLSYWYLHKVHLPHICIMYVHPFVVPVSLPCVETLF